MRHTLIVLRIAALAVAAFGLNAQPVSHPWFQVSEIGGSIWKIGDKDIDNIYLIEGKDSALVIDTGVGAVDLQAFLNTLTDRPLIVVNTHGHPDHAGSNNQFEKVYAHRADFAMIRHFTTRHIQRGILQYMVQAPVPDELKYQDSDTTLFARLIPIAEGKIFQLGGREVEVIEVPGHSGGSIALLDRQSKTLFTGDTNNLLAWLHTEDALPLDVFLRSLKKLRSRSSGFDRILPGHGEALDKTFLEEQITCVNNIISGKCMGTPYESVVGNGLLCTYKRAQVAYHPDKIMSR